MDHTQERSVGPANRDTEDTTLAFIEFVFAHAACESDMIEFRLDNSSLACWCPRCCTVGAFGLKTQRPPRGLPTGIPINVESRSASGADGRPGMAG